MGRTVSKETILLSSPSDLPDEHIRIIRNVIKQWNHNASRSAQIEFELLQWKDMAPNAEREGRGQIVIDDYFRNGTVSAVIAVFTNRLGTSTGAFLSGTVEEIHLAQGLGLPVGVFWNRWQAEIGLVDKQSGIYAKQVIDQYQQLDDFLHKSQCAGLYREYHSKAELRTYVGNLLDAFRAKLQAKRCSRSDCSPSAQPSVSTNPSGIAGSVTINNCGNVGAFAIQGDVIQRQSQTQGQLQSQVAAQAQAQEQTQSQVSASTTSEEAKAKTTAGSAASDNASKPLDAAELLGRMFVALSGEKNPSASSYGEMSAPVRADGRCLRAPLEGLRIVYEANVGRVCLRIFPDEASSNRYYCIADDGGNSSTIRLTYVDAENGRVDQPFVLDSYKNEEVVQDWNDDFEGQLTDCIATIQRMSRYIAMREVHQREWDERFARYVAATGGNYKNELLNGHMYQSVHSRLVFISGGRLYRPGNNAPQAGVQVTIDGVHYDAFDVPIIALTGADVLSELIARVKRTMHDAGRMIRRGSSRHTATNATNFLNMLKKYRDFIAAE